MTWVTTADVDQFRAAAGGLLRSRPAQNTILLTVTETLRTRDGTAFGATEPLFSS